MSFVQAHPVLLIGGTMLLLFVLGLLSEPRPRG